MADKVTDHIIFSKTSKYKHLVQTEKTDFRDLNVTRSQDVSILFADIVGFTRLSSGCTAEELVKMLNQLFGKFDQLASVRRCMQIQCTCRAPESAITRTREV